MSPRGQRPGGPPSAPVRRFLLAVSPDPGPPELAADDAAHALRVLRLQAGDRLLGLDGRGAEWPLVVVEIRRKALLLSADGAPTREPAPGEPGARLPRIEALIAWPKAGRPEAMLERLTQLGVARIRPWTTSRSTPPAPGSAPAARERRLLRVLAEACKQSGRRWLPELGPAVLGAAAVEPAGAPDVGLGVEPGVGPGVGPDGEPGVHPATVTAAAVLVPGAELGLAGFARAALAGGARRILLAIGPEGGLAPDEVETLRERGYVPVRLGPHVLRIETAAEAAVAIVAQLASEA